MAEYWAEDVSWRAIEGAPDDVGVMHGPERLRRYFQEWVDMFEGITNVPEELIDIGDDRVLAVQRAAGRAKLSGAETEIRFAVVYTVRDGKIVRGREYMDRAKALEALRQEGLVDARQGYGWFLAGTLRVPLGRLGTIEASLAAAGVAVERRVLDFAFVPAPAEVAEVLGPGEVLEVRRLNLAGGAPFARVTVWCPGPLGADLSRADVERTPFYELLPIELGAAIQTVGAVGASAADAEALGIGAGDPVLRCRRVTTSTAGEAVLVSEHVFAGHRAELVVELLGTEPSLAPPGMRLVDR
jgi:GntR family transcriptional regulator